MRTVWYITAFVALAALAILGFRAYYRAAGWHQEEAEAMLALLDRDPGLRLAVTRDAIKAVAGLTESGRLKSAEGYYALGLQEYGLSRLDNAESAYRKAIEKRPGWYRPHNGLAILLRKAGRLAEAEQAALEALRIDPDNMAVHNSHGNVLVALDQLEDASQAYQRAAELDPDHATPLYNLACVSSLQGNTDQALSYLTEAVALDEAYLAEAQLDPDLEALQGNLEFERLLGDQS